MGISCCVCINAEKMMTPRLILDNNNHLQKSANPMRKFNDIQPLDALDLNISQLDLVSLNQQLSEYIVQYEIKNGKITKRFTKRLFADESFNDKLFQKYKENIPQKINLGQLHHKQPIFLKQNSQLERQRQQQAKVAQQQIVYDNISSSFSQNYDSQLNEKNKSCLLSLSSRVLNASLFTDRKIQKDNFYKQFNTIFGVQLQKWTYNDRLSYDLKEDEILSFNKASQDGQFTISMASIYHYWINNCLNLLCYNIRPNAIKIYLNGQPKLYPITEFQQINLQSIHNFTNKLNIHQITHLTYLFTGWIPQIISISQLKQVNEVIQRLAANLEQGNTLITFSKQNQNQFQYTVLQKVDKQNQLIFMNTFSTKTTVLPMFLQNTQEQYIISPNLQVVSYQNFIQLFDYININWNPFIYELRINQQGILGQNQHQKKYMVIIPPSSQDLQLRLMIEKHHNFENKDDQEIIIKLYEYSNITSLGQPIRAITISEVIYSDVFIFQSCQEKTSYLLTIGYKQPQFIQKEITYTASLMSFAEIKFKPYKPKYFLKQSCLQAQITPQNTGYGINSPYFNQNLQFSITTQIGNDIQVIINTKKKLIYEICLIPDANSNKNLSKIKLQTIINNSQISNYNKGNGKLMITAQYKSYILLINAYTPTSAKLDIKVISYGYQTSDSQLSIQIINPSLQVNFTQEIKWLPTHSGPRKRLKSNSINDFQPLSTFKQFFNNPSIEKTLTNGKYQFYIKSNTFKELFDSLENYQDKNGCEPPALSMAVFLVSKNEKQLYKIILDDAFYVPFGIGFWSTQIQLEQGCYKFVFPRMNKEFSQGSFGIIKN